MVLAVAVSAARVGLWPLGSVPYSQIRTTSPTRHRDDCSGYVSMILGLATPGLSTVGLRNLVDPIPVGQLRRGDLLGNLGPGTEGDAGHVQWVDSVSATGTVTVFEQTGGSAGPHRNTYKRPGFPAWRVRGVDPTPAPPVSGDDDMPMYLLKTPSDHHYRGDGLWYAPIMTGAELEGWQNLVPPERRFEGVNLAWWGRDVTTVALAGSGPGGGGLTEKQVEDAAFRGAQRAEKE